MINPKLTFDDAFLRDVLTRIENAPKTLTTVIGYSVLPDVRQVALQALRQTPGPVVYPIEWKSLKQRRAYFATDGFGHGIPYRRTGALLDAWQVVFNRLTDYAGEIRAENDNPAAQWVIGKDQQPFHHNTGWYITDSKMPGLVEYADSAVMDAWGSVASFEYT